MEFEDKLCLSFRRVSCFQLLMVPPVCRYNKASFWTVLAGKHDLDNPHEPGQQVRNTQTQQSSFVFLIWPTINSKRLFFSKCVDLTPFLSAACGRICKIQSFLKNPLRLLEDLLLVLTFMFRSKPSRETPRVCLTLGKEHVTQHILSYVLHIIFRLKRISFIWCRHGEF